MLVPRNNILKRFTTLIRLDEILRLACQSASRNILHRNGRKKSCLKQLVEHHLAW